MRYTEKRGFLMPFYTFITTGAIIPFWNLHIGVIWPTTTTE